MATKHRYINTRFWNDSFVANLDSTEKLLFIYFLTNEHTNISGFYELPLKIMSIETAIDKDNLSNVLLPRFEKDKKVFYRNGWVAITNFIKHQALNPSIKIGIENELKLIPNELKSLVLEQAGDSLRQAGTYSILSNSILFNPLGLETNPKMANPDVSDETFKETTEMALIEWLAELWNKYSTTESIGVKNPKNTYAKTQLLKPCRKITNEMTEAIRPYQKKPHRYFEEAIKAYIADILNRNPKNDYAKHRFSFYEFLSQPNGLKTFSQKDA